MNQIESIEYYKGQLTKVLQSHGAESEYFTYSFFLLQAAKIGVTTEEMFNWAKKESDKLHTEALERLPSMIEGVEEEKVTIQKSREVSCNATETITYKIDKRMWEDALLDSDGDKKEALIHLQSDNTAERVDLDCEINEVSDEFDVTIEEI